MTMREMATAAAVKAIETVKSFTPGAEERARLKAEKEAGEDHLTDDGLESEVGVEPRRPPPAEILAITDTVTTATADDGASGEGDGGDPSLMPVSDTDASSQQGESKKMRSRKGARNRRRGGDRSPDGRDKDGGIVLESAMSSKKKKKKERKNVRIMEEGQIVTPDNAP